MQLTSHFSLEELCFSDTAIRNGIENVPTDPTVLANLQVLAEGAERVRDVLGCAMHVSSGHRCESLEKIICRKDFIGWCARHGKQVGDAAWSEYFARKAHPKGLALDFTAAKYGSPAKIVAALAEEADYINFDQCIEEGAWVHVAFPAKGKGRLEVMEAKFSSDGVASYRRVA